MSSHDMTEGQEAWAIMCSYLGKKTAAWPTTVFWRANEDVEIRRLKDEVEAALRGGNLEDVKNAARTYGRAFLAKGGEILKERRHGRSE